MISLHRLFRTFSMAVVCAGASVWSAASPADIKVGFVNVPVVLDKAPQAAAARDRIDKEFTPKDRALVAQQKELRTLEDQLIRDGSVMSDEQRVKLESDIRGLRRDIRRVQDEFREELNMRRNQELGKLQRRVLEVIQQLAKAEKFDLVVNDVGVLYFSETIDITEKVIARMKEAGE
jgi:outer membrane protein